MLIERFVHLSGCLFVPARLTVPCKGCFALPASFKILETCCVAGAWISVCTANYKLHYQHFHDYQNTKKSVCVWFRLDSMRMMRLRLRSSDGSWDRKCGSLVPQDGYHTRLFWYTTSEFYYFQMIEKQKNRNCTNNKPVVLVSLQVVSNWPEMVGHQSIKGNSSGQQQGQQLWVTTRSEQNSLAKSI